MKAVKAILAIALASQLLLACSNTATNSNGNANANANTKTTSTTTTTTNTANANSTAKANTNSAAAPAQQTSTTASGDNVYTHAEGGIQFELPAGWKATPDGDHMTLATQDNSLSVVLWVPAEDDFQQAVNELDKELSKTIKNVKANGEPRETTVGGMTTYSQAGTGSIEGSEIQWSVDVIQAKKPVIVLTFAAPGVWEKHQGEYQQFAKSIKKV
jgi:Icc-related predicted phosphoesterase